MKSILAFQGDTSRRHYVFLLIFRDISKMQVMLHYVTIHYAYIYYT